MSDNGAQPVELDDGFACYVGIEAEAKFGYREIFQDDTYRRADLPGAPVVIDVGAGIGLFTLFVKRARPAARVLAFEPVPENVRLLRRNIELHGATDVTVYPFCLGSEPADAASLTFYPRLPGNSTRYPATHGTQRELMVRHLGPQHAEELFAADELEVRVDRLSRVLSADVPDGPIDLLKLDVEGAELDVLDGIDDRDWARIGNLLVEVGDLDGTRTEVERRLHRRGLTVEGTRAPFMWDELEMYNVTARR